MLNRIFLGMLLAAIVVGMALGRGEELTSALLEQSACAVRLAIDMAGVMCLWSGLMKAAERAGLAAAVGKLLSPLTRRLFPKLSKKEQNQKGPKEGSALEAVTMNLTANFLGLGNAATPLGIKAMERMAAQSPKGSAATDEMILFLVCNTAAVQLFPSTLAAVRQASGAARPLDVLPAVWIASLAALAAGVGSALLMGRMSRRREGAGR